MAALTRHGGLVSSVFDLLGVNENDLTSALGFTLARSPALLDMVIRRVWPGVTAADIDAASLALEVRGDAGRTDLQITLSEALLIFEAKRDWLLPTQAQLRIYAPRVRMFGGGALVTLSQASSALAQVHLPAEVDGVPVTHVSWHDVLADLSGIRVDARRAARSWARTYPARRPWPARRRRVCRSWAGPARSSHGWR